MSSIPKIPEVPDDERTPLVTALLEIIQILLEQNQALKDEIAILKGQKPRPRIKPSALGKDTGARRTGEQRKASWLCEAEQDGRA